MSIDFFPSRPDAETEYVPLAQRRPTDALVEIEKYHTRIARNYDTLYGTPVGHAENDAVCDMLRRFLPRNARVLDVGCGTGLYIEMMQPRPEMYVGVDLSEGMLAVARDKYPGYRFLHADMHELALWPGPTFDAIVCLFGTIGYAYDLADVFRAFARVLRPGGSLFLVANSPADRPHTKAYAFPHEEAFLPPQNRLFAREWRTILGLSPFVDITLRGLNVWGDRLAWLSRFQALSLWLRLESATIGMWQPDRAAFSVLTARLPSSRRVCPRESALVLPADDRDDVSAW